MRKLSKRRAVFVAEYLLDLNATRAAIRAGYSERTAQEQSSRLLSSVMVQQEIQKRMEKRAAKVELKAEEVIVTIRETITRCKKSGKQFNPHAILKGCELLGRHLKLFTDRTETSGPNGGPIPIEMKGKSLAELAAEILKERNKDADAS